MDNQDARRTTPRGPAQKSLKEYLISQDKKHESAIEGLTEKLRRLEKAVETQNAEIKGLERKLLGQPDLQKPFIDLAERFLVGFEQMLEDATRDNVYLRAKSSLSQREQELIREENDLRLQIARCRRKVNALLRAVDRRAGEAGHGEAAKQSEAAGRADTDGQAEAAAQSEAAGQPEAVKQPEAAKQSEVAKQSEAAGQSEAAKQSEAAGQATQPALSAHAGQERVVHIVGLMADESKKPAEKAEAAPAGGGDESGAETALPCHELRLLYLMDKTAGEDLWGKEGELLIRQGEPICMGSAEKIYHQGLMEQLVQNIR